MEWNFTLEEINKAAAELLRVVGNKRVFAFHGSMGAGKTTFIHAVCSALRVTSVVSSPTFSIINEYRYINEGIQRSLYHMDLYRLRDEEEAQRAGVEDALFSGHICLVEWPEKAPGIFPEDSLHVTIEPVDTKTRRIKISNI